MLDRISIDPEIRSGKPIIRGMRYTVEDVIGWLAAGMTNEEILADFPELELEDIRQSLQFAYLTLSSRQTITAA